MILDGIVNFPSIVLFVCDNTGNPLALRLNGKLLRPYWVESLGAELPWNHGIAQKDALLIHPEGVLMPGAL